MSEAGPPPDLSPLDLEERRVLGTLIEKGLSTPGQYPMTLAALVAGCNQRSNRDPILRLDEEQVLSALERLRNRGLVSRIAPGVGSRVEKWRQEFGRKLELRRAPLAVLAELFLRGAQTLGELRQRASRMEPIPSLEALEALLDDLASRTPPLVVRLTPPGVRRGARVVDALRPAEEIEALRDRSPAPAAAPAVPRSSDARFEERLAALERRVAALEARLGSERGEESPPAGAGGSRSPDASPSRANGPSSSTTDSRPSEDPAGP